MNEDNYNSRGGYNNNQGRKNYNNSRGNYNSDSKRGYGYDNGPNREKFNGGFEREREPEQKPEEESKKLNFRSGEPKFLSRNPPKIISRSQEEKEKPLNESPKKEDSSVQENEPEEKKKIVFHSKHKFQREEKPAPLQSKEEQSPKKEASVNEDPSPVRKDSGVQTEPSEKPRFNYAEPKPYYKEGPNNSNKKFQKERPQKNEWVPKTESSVSNSYHSKDYAKVSKDSQEFHSKRPHKYSDQGSRPYSKPYSGSNFKGNRPKGKTEHDRDHMKEIFVAKEQPAQNPIEEKKSSPKGKKKGGSFALNKRESKNTSNVFEVLKPK